MGEQTAIEWCDHTFNPWVGCTKVSAACDFCYAEGWAKRIGQAHLWQGERRRTTGANWQEPLKWGRAAAAAGERRRVFCASLADVFDNQVPARWRDDLWHRIAQTPHLDWLLLTKRPQNIEKMLPTPAIGAPAWNDGWPNVWLGTTAENQEEADRRLPHLVTVPARVRFVSYEPALGPVDWSPWIEALHWIIAGGESGGKARPAQPDWFRSARDQCAAAGTAFLFKQWGGHRPKSGGRELDGRTHDGFPTEAVARELRKGER